MNFTEFNATLTGSDGQVSGVVKHMPNGVYRFTSIDESLILVIAKDAEAQWQRIDGTEPYFASWVEELAAQINHGDL
ncbi:hypothetical protein ACFQZS_06155 [Mucilaginibacter calamicampi]|uniref:Uncharacterized protein n=1 Tax=Mucilaginibacter calamicampi TaxID=1302352 RepID=A0ABW2YVA3_9SPHI